MNNTSSFLTGLAYIMHQFSNRRAACHRVGLPKAMQYQLSTIHTMTVSELAEESTKVITRALEFCINLILI
jgi:hypothetical protein